MNELLLMCLIAGRRAAIPAVRVQSVIEIDEITPIPATPDFICGLTALRSQALTVLDCSLALGLQSAGRGKGERAAVVEVDGHLYALLVEAAYDVGEARSEPIAVPGGFGPEWQRASTGMVETDGGPALLIDIAALVAGPVAIAA
ncbi:chemotaxis protein CheW [Qipengyuania marisflavi]|uniref:Chemotaxis protein CheW n=1 Tax=Qipengyuania marisflavi TaxID=2486356 RepID=A0A5S3P5D8_9SPHN|nr:chemotaxis protein CheW [Qipengyuania marisflavi]TMM47345.1 chemotaxis protein CheW [Qipengyuania marisflavi]